MGLCLNVGSISDGTVHAKIRYIFYNFAYNLDTYTYPDLVDILSWSFLYKYYVFLIPLSILCSYESLISGPTAKPSWHDTINIITGLDPKTTESTLLVKSLVNVLIDSLSPCSPETDALFINNIFLKIISEPTVSLKDSSKFNWIAANERLMTRMTSDMTHSQFTLINSSDTKVEDTTNFHRLFENVILYFMEVGATTIHEFVSGIIGDLEESIVPGPNLQHSKAPFLQTSSVNDSGGPIIKLKGDNNMREIFTFNNTKMYHFGANVTSVSHLGLQAPSKFVRLSEDDE